MDEILVILGIRPYGFTDKDTGKRIEGATLHTVNNNCDDKDVTGSLVDRVSISTDTLNALISEVDAASLQDLVGISVEPVYNKKGKVRHLHVVEQ